MSILHQTKAFIRRVAFWTDPPLFKGLVFFLLGAAVYLREPRFFTEPRFWAEEGQVFYSLALQKPWLAALFQPVFAQGYYSFLLHLTALVASRFFSLAAGPAVTTITAFLALMGAAALVLWGHSGLFQNWLSRCLAAVILIFVPVAGETWLNMTNVQFTLVLITTLILCEDMRASGMVRKWAYRVFLVAAGLTGLLSNLLTPVFYLKAWKDRTRENILQALLLTATTVIQSVIFINFLQVTDPSKRFTSWDLPTFSLSWILRAFLVPILGMDPAASLGQIAIELHASDFTQFSIFGYGALVILLGAALIWIWPVQNKPVIWLAAALGIISLFSFLTSITRGDKSILLNPSFSPRYYYAQTVLCFWLFAAAVQFSGKWRIKVISILSLGIIAAALIQSVPVYSSTVSYRVDWPVWRQEVEIYQKDPTRTRLAIWPGGTWYVDPGPR